MLLRGDLDGSNDRKILRFVDPGNIAGVSTVDKSPGLRIYKSSALTLQGGILLK